MVEEFYGKISRSGSNLSDRLEDKLTGDFFGTLRYMNFRDGLKKILLKALEKSAAHQGNAKDRKYAEDAKDVISIIEKIEPAIFRDGDNIEFWPRFKDKDISGELDVLLKFDSCYIGIEVKLDSGLSSADQLCREAEILKAIKPEKDKNILLFIAGYESCQSVYNNYYPKIKEKGVLFVCVSWEDILQSLHDINDQPLIIEDLTKLLTRKGFDAFSSMTKNLSNIKIEGKVFDMNNKKNTNDYSVNYKNAAYVIFMTYSNVKELLKAIKDESETRGIGYEKKYENEYKTRGITNDFWCVFTKMGENAPFLYAINIFLTNTNKDNPSEPTLKVLKYVFDKAIPDKIDGTRLAKIYDDNVNGSTDDGEINIKDKNIKVKKISINNFDYGVKLIYNVDLPLMDIRKEDVPFILSIFNELKERESSKI